MFQALPKLITFAEFIEWLPDKGCYELHDGVIVEMNPPVGFHEDIICFLAEKITAEYLRLNLPYGIPRTTFVKPPGSESSYLPDVLVINRNILATDPNWRKSAVIYEPDAIPLIIEVVSTNWQDDYYKKLGDYEKLGISEYWIVDYLGLGSGRFIGNPKQPTISVHNLIDGEYQVTQFRGSDLIVSTAFAKLNLTAEQIFKAGSI
ncbi:Uma2 family endonuclease [Trichormus sp. NMC-1]|uniref:Uma2 family endonuclease n=1 Tax=Trichormus sp. NMC-1 TaxID=1853259 RepID=UPI0008DC0F59|nr:Uma2 family endonuclease [Trichormus sp. NMC-1]